MSLICKCLIALMIVHILGTLYFFVLPEYFNPFQSDDICLSEENCFKPDSSNPSQLTTLVIMAYTNNDALMMVLSEYNDCRKFGGVIWEIIIVWNNPNMKFNYNHCKLIIDTEYHIIPIIAIDQETNSMSNRWFVSRYHNFKTQSAIFIDDDIFMNQYTINCLLLTFNKYPNKIIGPSSAIHRNIRVFQKIDDNNYKYNNPRYSSIFNMILPGMSIFNIHYLSLLADKFDEYNINTIIDEQIAHCDDIAVILFYGIIMDGKPFIFGIDDINIEDYSIYRGEQIALTDTNNLELRYKQRSECLTMLIQKIIDINRKNNNSLIEPIVNHNKQTNIINCLQCEYCHKRACKTKKYQLW